jgi:predicted Zn-dependent protease
MNYQAEPENPYFVTTQAFALYKQNKPKEALALLETLRPSALSTPERVMFRALFRAAAGDGAGSADLLTGLRSTGFLPEERRLVARAMSDIAQLRGQKGQDLLLMALNSRGEIDRTKGWLRALPEDFRTNATVEMQTTDSLLAMGDMTAFAAQLRKGTWGEYEHLRLALTAYSERIRSGVTSSRSYWRTALGSASGSASKLGQLEALTSQWGWRPEQMDVLARRFDIDPGNKTAFTELMDFYRQAGRTAELVAVLNSYLSAHPDDQQQRCNLAYYSMLSGLNLARAYVVAQEVYRAAPNDANTTSVYAFALWKQRRAREAWELLEHVGAGGSPLVPVILLRAAVLADIDRKDEALKALTAFDTTNALPEEANLALILKSRLKENVRVTQAN